MPRQYSWCLSMLPPFHPHRVLSPGFSEYHFRARTLPKGEMRPYLMFFLDLRNPTSTPKWDGEAKRAEVWDFFLFLSNNPESGAQCKSFWISTLDHSTC